MKQVLSADAEREERENETEKLQYSRHTRTSTKWIENLQAEISKLEPHNHPFRREIGAHL